MDQTSATSRADKPKKVKDMLNTIIKAAALFALSAGPAFAYIDPGTGSAVLQGILGAIAALALTVKLWWHKLLVLLGIRKRRERNGETENRSSEEK